MSRIHIVPTDLDTVVPLRMTLSIPPRSREAALSSGDTADGVAHFAAYLEGQLVGVCSIGPEALPILQHAPAWRTRGLVVLPKFRDRGVGLALVRTLLQFGESKPNPLVWGYAKQHLIPLYELVGVFPTGYRHVHHSGGNTMLVGNKHTLRLIRDATGITYTDGEVPEMGCIDTAV
jgi:GNAT superfamily N-acetyltransferase